MNIWARYPRSRLVHERVLQSFGRPRGLSIVPIPGPPVEPPEIVHHNSCVVTSMTADVAYVVEWTGDETELHYVHLS